MAQIVDLIARAYTDYMSAKLRDDLAVDDPTRVEKIRPGRLQEDPTQPDTYLTMHANKPGETNWRHTGSTTDTSTPYGIQAQRSGYQVIPQFEIGGGMLWWRRMSAEMGLFYLARSYTRAQAQEIAHMAFGRFEYYLMRANFDNDAGVLGLTDSFGETALQVYLHSTNYGEGGGPEESFIWRGEFWFDILTERTFD